MATINNIDHSITPPSPLPLPPFLLPALINIKLNQLTSSWNGVVHGLTNEFGGSATRCARGRGVSRCSVHFNEKGAARRYSSIRSAGILHAMRTMLIGDVKLPRDRQPHRKDEERIGRGRVGTRRHWHSASAQCQVDDSTSEVRSMLGTRKSDSPQTAIWGVLAKGWPLDSMAADGEDVAFVVVRRSWR